MYHLITHPVLVWVYVVFQKCGESKVYGHLSAFKDNHLSRFHKIAKSDD